MAKNLLLDSRTQSFMKISIFSFVIFLSFLSDCNAALNCSDEQWKKCNDDLQCLSQESGSCGNYIKRLLQCPICQINDNEADTIKCFVLNNC